ncbi:hypothetical protein D3C84_835940 [compost metagenome]
MEKIGQGQARVPAQWRVVLGGRVLQTKQFFTVGHAEHRRQQAFADGPGQVRGLGGGRPGVAFVDQPTVLDHQQRIGADALAARIVPGWEGVLLQGFDGRPAQGRATWPLLAGPVFGVGAQVEQQQRDQEPTFGHARGSQD